MQLSNKVEDKILDAAKKVFTERGLELTKMSDIADAAGISRTSLNYYFRSKEILFQAIIGQVAALFWPNLESVLEKELSVSEKIKGIINQYNGMLIGNPLLPNFMSIEIRRDSNQLIKAMRSKMKGAALENFGEQIKEEMQEGKIKQMDISHIFVTITSLCIFPFLAKPLLDLVFFDETNTQFNNFMKERKEMTIALVLKFLQPD